MSFEKIKGKLGFGVMRLQMIENEIDKEESLQAEIISGV